MLELSGEVTSLKTELGSVGRDMKGVTDITSELTIKTPFYTALGMTNENAAFLHCLELDTVSEMTNGKLRFYCRFYWH